MAFSRLLIKLMKKASIEHGRWPVKIDLSFLIWSLLLKYSKICFWSKHLFFFHSSGKKRNVKIDKLIKINWLYLRTFDVIEIMVGSIFKTRIEENFKMCWGVRLSCKSHHNLKCRRWVWISNIHSTDSLWGC